MKTMLGAMKHLQHNPFFRTVGRFKGLTQESLILQKASGYSQVYRIWNLLRRAYSLNDGIYRLQSKDIATLYEIWCFIEVSHIVKDQLGIDTEVDHRNRMEMNGVFTWELGKGEHSRILFKKDNVELAELVYNPKHTEKVNDNISMENLYVPTVAQKPDIVLQLTKNDMQKGMKMTYLFDAKYRIDGRNSKGVDTPPEDAINQMHRYRDAIYYKNNSSEGLKKEVVGGYILFPGDGEPADVEVARFYETIDEVNIGAFPLRPKDCRNRQLLKNFIQELISMQASEILADSIPHKGLVYTDEDEMSMDRKWKRTKVLLFVDPVEEHWQEADSNAGVALGLDFNEFSLKIVKSFSAAKYVAVVSQHMPENKKMILYKVNGSPEIFTSVHPAKCWVRRLKGQKDEKGAAQAYLFFPIINPSESMPSLCADKVHAITAGSHNPRIVNMEDIMNWHSSKLT